MISKRQGFSLLIILFLITNTNTSPRLHVKAQDCKPSGLIMGQNPPPGQCGAEADSNCCTPGQNYTAYRCSPPVTNRTNAVLFVSGFEGPTSCENKNYDSNNTLVVSLSTGWFSNGSRCGRFITITGNGGNTTQALVVDECNSYMGCDAGNGYQPPCSNYELVASRAVWYALGVFENSHSYGKMNITWSPINSTSPSRDHLAPHKRNNKIVIVVVVSAVVLVLIVVSLLVIFKRLWGYSNDADEEHWENSSVLLSDLPKKFTFKELKSSTNNFNEQRKLGAGGFGSVFDGTLKDSTRVAVKFLDHFKQGKNEFITEVKTMGSLHHFNLVKLIGFCAEKGHKLLVYEYMSNGSLDKWIFRETEASINWDMRKKIILHIAKGLSYLHEDCKNKILHLDIKPQNILLDNEFNAKLSDFGLAKLIDKDQSFSITHMRGTPGYLAPEWLSRKITEKVDVYSYGIVMLEVLFERKNFDVQENPTLVEVVRESVEANQLANLINEHNDEEMQKNIEDVEKILKLAIWCLQADPVRRPSMSTIVKVLEGAMALEPVPDSSHENSTFPDAFGEISSMRTFEISSITFSR